MIFKKVELKNFRQYDDVVIEFDENINVIEAGNGIGKSTLMASLIYAMYGYEDMLNSKLIEITDNNPIFNIKYVKGIESGYTVPDVEVKLTVRTNEEEDYTIIRSYNPNEDKHSVRAHVISSTSNYEVKEIAVEEIDMLVPKEFIPLLFFDGERIKTIEDSFTKPTGDFKKEVEKILKINEYHEAQKFINRSKNDLVKETYSEKSEVGRLDLELSMLQRKVSHLKEEIDDKTNTISNLNKTKNEVIVDMKKIERISKVVEEIENEKKLQNEYELECERINMKAKKELIISFPDLIKINIYEKILEEINNKKINYKIKGIEQTAIDAIIANNECICSTPLNDELKYVLTELRKSLPPESFQTILSYSLECKEEDKKKLIGRINEYMDEYGEKLDKVTETKNSIKIKKDSINIDDCGDNGFNLKEQLSSIEDQISEEDRTRYAIEKNLEKHEVYYEEKRRLYNIALEKEREKNTEKKCIKLMEEAVQVLNDVKKKRTDNLRIKMQDKINLYANEFLFDEIDIELDEKLSLKKTKLRNGAESLSTGQKVMISLAYLFALMETSKTTLEFGDSNFTGEIHPIIFDGVTATLDHEHSQKFITYIMKNDGQSIIFSNTKEVKQFERGLNNKFKKIVLNKEQNSDSLNVEEA